MFNSDMNYIMNKLFEDAKIEAAYKKDGAAMVNLNGRYYGIIMLLSSIIKGVENKEHSFLDVMTDIVIFHEMTGASTDFYLNESNSSKEMREVIKTMMKNKNTDEIKKMMEEFKK